MSEGEVYTFLYNPKEILAIYQSGIERGKEEQSAYEWGSSLWHSNRLDELEDVLVWDRETSVVKDMDYDEKVEWWKGFKECLT